MPYFEDTQICQIEVDTKEVLNDGFAGVGFHVAHYMNEDKSNKEHFEQVLAKRWRELGASFARLWHNWQWNKKELNQYADHILRMKNDTNTTIYITSSVKKVSNEDELKDYAKLIADHLEYLIRDKGCTNIKYYCMCNELSMHTWGDMRYSIETFKKYHSAFYKEFEKRKLPVKLLATDASPKERWGTMLWAEENMDDITGVYGGHTYFNDMLPDFKSFTRYWTEYTDWAGELSRRTGKQFILGEFGCKQDARVVDGILLDRCAPYYDEKLAPLVALQLAEAVIASINSGLYAMATWTFSDYPGPENPRPESGARSVNKWGVFRWSDEGDYSTRDHYYGYGLLSKFLNGPGKTLKVKSYDHYIHPAAMQHENGTWSFAVVNRNEYEAPLKFMLDEKLNLKLRKYVYDSSNVPQNPFGDLQDFSDTILMEDGVFNDSITPETLIVYTSDFTESIPAKIEGVKVEKRKDNSIKIRWDHSKEKDLCYYRVFRGEKEDFVPGKDYQIASTIANEYIDSTASNEKTYVYKICAVNNSGNM